MSTKLKLINNLSSVKVWVLALSTLLLYFKVIDQSIWRDVIIGVVAARAALDGITAFKPYSGPVEK